MNVDSDKAHICKLMPQRGVYLEFVISDYPSWNLRIQAEATGENLEQNGYLEYEGQPIWVTQIEVRCCPYCGKKLPGIENTESRNYGKYWHSDLAQW